ncbi:MAG TPA: 23S rRNA (pseudouridine(1915)-N(3))-methyltransferase RlmH [Dongiaceae bacterium]|jgi:23S rRNA (pseudouridine1915-N3)-methyltransferase|nr:23S rRNA (pseudouridine(1915)-N(3))-methyltransferase RlmH [Dongiaceae bacterium]
MKLRILAVGRAKSGPEADLIAEYRKRLHWPLAIEEVEEKRPLSGAELKAREAALLQIAIDRAAAKAGGRPVLVALDERGKSLGSRDFAARLKAWEDQGAPEILFMLGGADGLAPEMRDQSAFVLSLGQMTWPHLLARAMLVEQIYRAQQILAGHPYHRD